MHMMSLMKGTILGLSLLASSVHAAVSADEAAKLGASLTPLGGEKAGNADGSIPAWDGGLKPGAAKVENGFLGDPFPDDKPLFVITAATAQQYKDKLSNGQVAMFKRYPDTYRIPVYTTRRTAASPQTVYEAAKVSALHTEEVDGGNGLANFQGRNYAFPIPKNGVEVVWNHLTRYRGPNQRRLSAQATPQTNGSFTAVEFEEDLSYPQLLKDADPKQTENVLFFYKQRVTAPARLAGNVLLVHETIDQVKEPRLAWVYNAGQRRVRRAPQVAYDGPGTAADGMRTSDDSDMYNGAPDRYDWKLVGKKEMYIPYNNYRLWSPKLKYTDILQAGHVNPDLTRYELHRVWEVVATLKPNQRHIYATRRFYFDEDTWQAVESEAYDGRGQLWRVGEGFAVNDYQQGTALYAVNALNDLIAGRYLAMAMINEARRGIDYSAQPSMSDFTPAALRNAGIR
ncbi:MULTISPECIES: DUF1329 domain-containing protein [unclassified Pseudomonas]|uniref:DUF1329 domain-containing protein n=1 Tax=unclassified Pseudomonas TaxID=196821 RepID=UPI00177B74D2|nr:MULTISPECIES: DUF1329 domain-containing protein [unclassified Pseudomonas]MBD9517107.1 DUF1329 domain-containing protein [Pseudomonas sp. PDM22]MBD9629650.1 DUF1329 domain-containing protein [Pseudomonas sp. PDM19]